MGVQALGVCVLNIDMGMNMRRVSAAILPGTVAEPASIEGLISVCVWVRAREKMHMIMCVCVCVCLCVCMYVCVCACLFV